MMHASRPCSSASPSSAAVGSRGVGWRGCQTASRPRWCRQAVALSKPDAAQSDASHSLASSRGVPQLPVSSGPVAAAVPAPLGPEPWRRWDLVSRTALAGGVLEVVYWAGDDIRGGELQGRTIRVWLPPGYSPTDSWHGHPYQVLYLCDGQNLGLGECSSMSGSSWGVAEAAAELITSGRLPPFIIVGIDHAGALRSEEFTPYRPGTGPGGFRADAADWPGGGVAAHLDRIRGEIVPWVAANYFASTDPADLALGGSSFGGIAALFAALQGPEKCGFGALLVESPSLWIAEEAFLADIQAYRGQWPQRVYVGMGGREFSGNRGYGAEHDGHFLRYMSVLYKTLTEQAQLGPDRLSLALDPQAAHIEAAWAWRLPAALHFACGGWWQRWADRFRGQLFFTCPRRLKAGLAGQVLFFNKQTSHTLCHLPREAGVVLVMGVNGWQGTVQLPMVPVDQGQQLQLQQQLAATELQDEVHKQWQQEYQTAVQKQKQQQLLQLQQQQQQQSKQQQGQQQQDGNSAAEQSAAQQEQQEQQELPAIAPHLQQILDRPSNPNALFAAGQGDWFMVCLPELPGDSYELNMVFSDNQGSHWDNCGGSDFCLPVRQTEAWREVLPPPVVISSSSSAAEDVDSAALRAALVAAAEAAAAPAGEAAAAAAASELLFFSLPSRPLAGAPMTLFCNHARLSHGLDQAPNLTVQMGFNGWSMEQQRVGMQPTSLRRDRQTDFWSARIHVPEGANSAEFVFSATWNGQQQYDNNDHKDFQLQIEPAATAAAAVAEAWAAAAEAAAAEAATAAAAAAEKRRAEGECRGSRAGWRLLPPLHSSSSRRVAKCEAVPHAGGTLELLQLEKRAGASSRRQHWWDEKCIRVWLPPGYSRDPDAAPPGGWPMLLMADGQNMFDDKLAHQGVSWNLGETASALLSAGSIPPAIVVGLDSAGSYRSFNYLPFKPGTGTGGFRGDAARWPGGGAADFLQRVEHEILPLLQQRYHTGRDPSRVAFGGGSFAGVTALMAAIKLPHVFGGVLVESPSLWVGEGRFLREDLASYSGRLPERLSLGCGGCEYSATRDHDRPDVDALLLQQYHECARLLQERGLRGGSRFRFVVEQGAGHHEGAWRWRLGGALSFLAQGWYS